MSCPVTFAHHKKDKNAKLTTSHPDQQVAATLAFRYSRVQVCCWTGVSHSTVSPSTVQFGHRDFVIGTFGATGCAHCKDGEISGFHDSPRVEHE